MRTTTTHSYQARRPVLLANPMASIPLFRPVHAVMGWTSAQNADFCVTRDRNNLATVEGQYADACAMLGRANAHKTLRRMQQAAAMGCINRARAALRRARLALAASLAASATFALAA